MDLSIKGNSQVLNSFNKLFTGVSAFSGGRQKVGGNAGSLKRWKAPANYDCLQVIPVMLHVPFNPDTGAELPVALPIPLSVRTAIKYLKYRAASNPVVKKALLESLNCEEGKINFEDIDTVTNAEYDLFKPLRNFLVYGRTVMSVRDPASKFPFGSTYQIDLDYDEETGRVIDSPNNPLPYQLFQLESTVNAIYIQTAKDNNEKAGNERRTDKEMEAFAKSVWEERVFSNPYFLGTTRILEIPTNSSYDVTDQFSKAWQPSVDHLRKSEYYIKVNRAIRNSLEGILGSKFDLREDYLLVRIHVPDYDDKTKASAIQGISRTGAGRDEMLSEMLNDFDKVYAEFRDTQELWSEKLIRNIFEYRKLGDDQALAFFRAKLPVLQAYMKTPDVIEKYQSLIALVDKGVSTELMTAAMLGDTIAPVDYKSTLEAAPVVNEDTPGYGGDSLDAAPVGLGVTEADRQALDAAMDPTSALAAAMSMNE